MTVTPQVIVPVALLEGEVIPEPLVEFLSTVPVVVLGYHEIPEQTLSDQARDEFGDQATAAVAAVAETFERHGASVETELVFTQDPTQSIQQIADEMERGVILHPEPVRSIDRVLVAVREKDLVPAITTTLAALIGPTDASITLMGAIAECQDGTASRRALSGMRTALQEAGIPAHRIEERTESAQDIETVLLDASSDYDLVVLGETDPSVLTWLFGSTAKRVADQTLSPVLVVQRPLAE
jgi:nucleotide-binding universal stress UspA family protein